MIGRGLTRTVFIAFACERATEGLALMRGFYRIGCAMGLAFVLGGPAAHSQGTGPATNAPAVGVAAGVPAGGDAAGGVSSNPDDADEKAQPIAKQATSLPKTRMSSFNRVTTTRKVVVPAPSQSARSGAATAGAAGTSTSSGSKDRTSATKKTEVPTSSTWRQVPERATRPAATATRSVTHNYYPGLRGGQYKNANTARVANGGKTAIPAQAGVGMSAAGARSAAAGRRAGQAVAPGRSPAASASARPRR